MARLAGGIFSSPSGHNNGLVFGKGRTRDGKKTTVRELVKPSNPNTMAQQAQRSRFSAALQVVKELGRPIYQFDWNNAVDELPGFHSLMSRIIDATEDQGAVITAPAATSLGSRHFPETFTASAGTDEIEVTWSTETGDIGDATDIAKIVAIQSEDSGPEFDRTVIVDTDATRTDGSATLPATGVSAGDFIVGLWFEGTGIGIPSGQVYSAAEFVTLT